MYNLTYFSTFVIDRIWLQSGLESDNTQSAIELLMTQPTLLENLRKAHLGNYSVVLSLLGCLDRGLQAKKLVDRVIDASMC
jgi:hypothetical protein